MADLRSVEALILAYPDGKPELDNVGMPYSDFGKEAAYTVALGTEAKLKDRCTACGLRVEAWTELAEAQYDFVSAQAHWEAARVFGITDPQIKEHVKELFVLRDELLDQASFYFTTPDDVQRIAILREGDDIPDCVSDARALVQMIRPRVASILDPEFKAAWLDRALELAELVEKGRAGESASATANPAGQRMRKIRDRTAARVDTLQKEIRRYGKHAFRNDPKLSGAFASAYMRRMRRNAPEQDKTTAPSAPAGSAQPALGGNGSPFANQ